MSSFLIIPKNMALMMSALFVLQLSGCRSLRSLPLNEIQSSEKMQYYVHGQDIFYQISGTAMSDGILTGIISNPSEPPARSKVMHIYIAPDSAIRVKDNVVSIPFSNIAKAETYEKDVDKAIFIGVGAANAALWALLLITF